jgi:hypothetical protein
LVVVMVSKLRWNAERLMMLKRLHAQGLSDQEMAARLDSTRAVIASRRAHQLGLRINSAPRFYEKPPSRVAAKRVNEQPWDPPPGMTKLRCQRCEFWFSAPRAQQRHCPDCKVELTAVQRREAC